MDLSPSRPPIDERAFYDRQIGILAPRLVADVKLDTESQQADVLVEHNQGTVFCCPDCGKACFTYEHTAERQRRHLDTMQFKTMLHANPR